MYSSDDLPEFPSSPGDFSPLAYVRPVQTDKGIAFGVYAADGTQLATFSSRDAAMCAARQHNLEPVLIH